MARWAESHTQATSTTKIDALARFRWLSRDFERLPQVLASPHFVAFAMLMVPKVASVGVGIGQ